VYQLQAFPDLFTLLKDAGLPITITIIFGYLLFRYLIAPKFSALLESHDAALKKIDSMEGTTKEVHSLMLTLTDGYENHIEDTKRMADEELWKHCPIERCPNLQKVITFLETINRELKDFAESAKESKSATQDSIVEVSSKIDNFINGLGSEFIATLRDMRKNNSRNEN
jgi:hypothetical protein